VFVHAVVKTSTSLFCENNVAVDSSMFLPSWSVLNFYSLGQFFFDALERPDTSMP